jgi:spore germination protein YaaH
VVLSALLVLPFSAFATTPTYHPVRLFYYTDDENAKKSFLKNAWHIDIFAPQVYELRADGTLSGTLEPELIRHAKKNKAKIMPLVTNEKFSSTSHKDILDDPNVQAIALNALIAEAKNHGYYGWQFDFEQMDVSYRDKFSAFVARAADLFKPAGLVLSVAVVAKISDNPTDYPNNLWQKLIGVYDYDALAKSADFISVMSYDDPTSKGPAVQFAWLEKVLAYSLKHIPNEKLSLGLALYYWARDTSTRKLIGIGGNETIDKIFAKRKVVVTFDDINKMPVMHYTADGVLYSLWYENAKSIAYKLALIKQNKLHGFSAWTLGLEVPSVSAGAGHCAHLRSLVAGGRLARPSRGYASHDNFHCAFRLRDLDYAFNPSGCLSSSLYTFPSITLGTWLGIAVCNEAGGFRRIWQVILRPVTLAHARIEPRELLLLYPAIENALEKYTLERDALQV